MAKENKAGDRLSWLDGGWGCKVCGGEIPYGHDSNCDIYKMQAEIDTLKATIASNDAAWKADIHKSGMGVMIASNGRFIMARPEVENRELEKTLEVIHENIDLSIRAEKAEAALVKSRDAHPGLHVVDHTGHRGLQLRARGCVAQKRSRVSSVDELAEWVLRSLKEEPEAWVTRNMSRNNETLRHDQKNVYVTNICSVGQLRIRPGSIKPSFWQRVKISHCAQSLYMKLRLEAHRQETSEEQAEHLLMRIKKEPREP